VQVTLFPWGKRIECPHGGGFGVHFEIRIHGSEPQFSLSVLVVNFAFRQRQLSVKLDVEDNEAVGCRLQDDAEETSVEQPLGPHTESNGSHGMVPPEKIRVSSFKGPERGSQSRRPDDRR
jgi:hypothetical protein